MTSSLMVVLWCFFAHQACNTALLSAWSPWRCFYWGMEDFHDDESWFCNWYSTGHLHVTTLLICSALGKTAKAFEMALAYMCCIIIVIHSVLDWWSGDLLDPPLVLVQVIQHVFVLGLVWFYTMSKRRTHSPNIFSDEVSKADTEGDDENAKDEIEPRSRRTTTGCVAFQFVASLFRYVDMAFGGRIESYIGEMSSPNSEDVFNRFSADLGIVTLLLAFTLWRCNDRQQKNVLYGHALVLFVSQLMLVGRQGDLIRQPDEDIACIVTFTLIAVAFAGSLL